MTPPPGAPADEPAGEPLGPVAALERIGYLLDRMLAPAPKVRAFRRAADVVAELAGRDGEGAVAELARAGRIRELPGVGASTGKVIEEAVAGKVPAYLARLEEESVVPLSDAGVPFRHALRGDCHLHSDWSDGGASIEAMAVAARDLGHDWIVLTDHSPRLTVAHGLSRERLEEQLVEIDRLNEDLAPFRILTGMEVDILPDGALDLPDDLLARLDVVVASVHMKLRMERRPMTERLVRAVANPHVDILGHCTGRKLSSDGELPASDTALKRPPSEFDPDYVLLACARFGTAVEINCRPERQDPPDELLSRALELGCEVVIDTDSHAPGQLEWQAYGCDKAARVGVPLDRVVNTRTADELVAWAAEHAPA